jgi:hypothetical protein
MTQFLDNYMAMRDKVAPVSPQSALRQQSVPRIDFDEVELRKALKASKSESIQRSLFVVLLKLL